MAETPQPKLLTDIVLDELTVCKEPANDDCRAAIVKSRDPQPKPLTETTMSIQDPQEADDLIEFDLSEEDVEELAKEIEELNEAGELVPAFAALIADQAEAEEAISKMLEYVDGLESEHEELKKSASLLVERVEKMSRDGAAGHEDQSLVAAIRKNLNGQALDEHTAMRIDALELVAKQAETDKAIAKAREFGVGDAAKLGPALLVVRKRAGDDIANLIEAELKAAGAIVAKSKVFSPIGVSNAPSADSPIAKAKQMADEIRKSDPKLSEAEAVAKAFEADPALYDAYLAETRGARR